MESSNQIASRFKDVILEGRWIAHTNFKDLLSDVTWKQATTKIGSLNTLAALAFHINYYIAGLVKVFDGGPLEIRDKYSFDAPLVSSKADWDNRLNDLWSNAEKFTKHVETMSEEQLGSAFVMEEYGSYRRNIEGVIEHSYYHLGQVSLIKKMILEAEN